MSTEIAEPPFEVAPAGPEDLPLIRQTIESERLDPDGLELSEFLTLREGERIVAFGRIKPYRQTYELCNVTVMPERRGRGLGARMVRELIDRFPQDEVHITTDMPDYFGKLGFLRTEVLPVEIEAKIGRPCESLRPGTLGMVYDRNIERLPTIADVYRARRIMAPHLPRTPLVRSAHLSRQLECEAYLKLESLQPIGAFKVRGGVNLAATLSPEERQRGIVGASTGNHGQSLAYGARLFGIRCVIFAPEEANELKIEAMRRLGAEVVREGADFEEARAAAEDRARREGLRYVHHINEPLLVAGVATISLEVVEDLPDVDVIIVPIGGGSGAVGHCIVAKALRPGLRLIGVQAEGAPAVYRSWKERKLQRAPIDTFAEGLATGIAFPMPVSVLIRTLDDFLLVSEEEMRRAIILLLEGAHVLAEAAGAAATAAAVKLGDQLRGKKVAIMVTGGNLELETLRRVLG
ncbi:MAG: pyridoxal-phosphate dependent enzyme [Chloroflexi bacterium]|nr:pyridoxal-phosphate dependent enzyme [Chloroflexota bacterium]